MSNNIQAIPSTDVSFSPVAAVKSRRPWSFASMAVVSLILGIGASYLIVWQNLKRVGKNDVAKKFFWIGLAILVGMVTTLFFAADALHLSKASGNVLALGFLVWFYFKYLASWQIASKEKPGFDWVILGWGLLGLVASLVIVGLLVLIFPQSRMNRENFKIFD